MKVCFLGLGSMGSGVCRNLLNKGLCPAGMEPQP